MSGRPKMSNWRFNADANTGHGFAIFMASVGALCALAPVNLGVSPPGIIHAMVYSPPFPPSCIRASSGVFRGVRGFLVSSGSSAYAA